MISNPTRLYLIGTIHLDLYKGPQRLVKLLELLHPTDIGLECDPLTAFAVSLGRGSNPELKRAYEIWVPLGYRETDQDVSLAYLDTDIIETSAFLKQRIDKQTEFDETAEFNKEEQDWIDSQYDGRVTDKLPDYLIRNETLEREIRAACKPDNQIFVCIVGNSHVFDSYPNGSNLSERLSDLKPTKIKLRDADRQEVLRQLSLVA